VRSRRSSESAKSRKRRDARYAAAKISGGPTMATRTVSGGRDGPDSKTPAKPADSTSRNHAARMTVRIDETLRRSALSMVDLP
jgi:hypothetical protein